MDPEERARRAKEITDVLPTPEGISDDWGGFIMDTVMDGVWARPGLSPRERSLITIAALTALYRPNELRLHVRRGLQNGLREDEINEVIMHMAVYGGFPVGVEAMGIAKEVFDDQAQGT